jgi:methylated-DNA-[protein]-cysteine S-methyltransferase
MTSTAITIYESPIGPLTLEGGPRGLTALSFPGRRESPATERDADALAAVVEQLDAYFAGELQRFDVAVDLRGTEFQLAVWKRLRAIRFGETVSYGELAASLGRRDRVRAVGAAVGRTPVPIIVPCHRVIGADGSLTGYGGGLERKRALLELEGAIDRPLAPNVF